MCRNFKVGNTLNNSEDGGVVNFYIQSMAARPVRQGLQKNTWKCSCLIGCQLSSLPDASSHSSV